MMDIMRCRLYLWRRPDKNAGGDWVGSSGTAAYENWAQGKPSGDGNCVGISTTDRKMANFDCASTWPSYCSISNLVLVWTGLRYLSHKWFWVDGTEVPYQDLPHCPDLGHYCGTLVRDNSTIDWKIRNCSEKRNFLCYKIQI
ncbi:hypothetical protein NHX12_005222 [Muraenolepis orangiensis]|uniref:C-type lectin domain-containing protein n=1 Tax=Muraenolepis orangiensis TaxID=630683 RepID=A0A9Q0IBV2_9TELE|nr:hypothetical protein NHX12_005222 [Muraenolepis orangiensis]